MMDVVDIVREELMQDTMLPPSIKCMIIERAKQIKVRSSGGEKHGN